MVKTKQVKISYDLSTDINPLIVFYTQNCGIKEINDYAIAVKYHEYSTNNTKSPEFNKNQFKKELLTFYKVPEPKMSDFEKLLNQLFCIPQQRVSRKRAFYSDEYGITNEKEKVVLRPQKKTKLPKPTKKTKSELLKESLMCSSLYLDDVVKRIRQMKKIFDGEPRYKKFFEEDAGILDIINMQEQYMNDLICRSFTQESYDLINAVNKINGINKLLI